MDPSLTAQTNRYRADTRRRHCVTSATMLAHRTGDRVVHCSSRARVATARVAITRLLHVSSRLLLKSPLALSWQHARITREFNEFIFLALILYSPTDLHIYVCFWLIATLQVINAFLHLLNEMQPPAAKYRVHSFSTFFYTKYGLHLACKGQEKRM